MVAMKTVARIYDAMLAEHLASHRQMALVSVPRQVGKTTTCRRHADSYTNWDNVDDREVILGGPARLVERLGLNRLSETPTTRPFCAQRTGRAGGKILRRVYSIAYLVGLAKNLAFSMASGNR